MSDHPASSAFKIVGKQVRLGRQVSIGKNSIQQEMLRRRGQINSDIDNVVTQLVGRKIAANDNYICYILNVGSINVRSLKTGSTTLHKVHTEGISDICLFAANVDLLACASEDGSISVWEIAEGPDKKEKMNILMSIQILGELGTIKPRVCWHCDKKDVLIVGIGRSIFQINTTKVGQGKALSLEHPLICSGEKINEGVRFVGNHDGDVTDMSMCRGRTSYLVSASLDGMVKVLDEGNLLEIKTLSPYDGLAVHSVTVMTSPFQEKQIVLICGDPFNRNLKIWTAASEEAQLTSGADSWNFTEMLSVTTSAMSKDVYPNNIVPLYQEGILLLPDANLNKIHIIQLDYGHTPAELHAKYKSLSKIPSEKGIFTSFTGTSGLIVDEEKVFVLYCVHKSNVGVYRVKLKEILPIEGSDRRESGGRKSAETSSGPTTLVSHSVTPSDGNQGFDDKREEKATVHYRNPENVESVSPHQTIQGMLNQDVVHSASSVKEDLKTELAKSERKPIAGASSHSNPANPLDIQQSNEPKGGAQSEVDMLISEQRYDEAFKLALGSNDITLINWICSQVQLSDILTMETLSVSQGVLLLLLQQLSDDITTNTLQKLRLIRDVAVVVNPHNSVIAEKGSPVLQQVLGVLQTHMALPTTLARHVLSFQAAIYIIHCLLDDIELA